MARKSIDEVVEITKEVKDKYLFDKRYKQYIEKIFPSYYTKIGKKPDEIVEDWCIRFLLKDKLPSYLPVPNSYKDVRIFIEMTN